MQADAVCNSNKERGIKQSVAVSMLQFDVLLQACIAYLRGSTHEQFLCQGLACHGCDAAPDVRAGSSGQQCNSSESSCDGLFGVGVTCSYDM
jgi:hypothetical protein